MKEENLTIIKENVLSLFDIADSETGIKFLNKLDKYASRYNVKTIKEIIYACNENEIIPLISILISGKFTENPDKYYDPIKEVFKSESK